MGNIKFRARRAYGDLLYKLQRDIDKDESDLATYFHDDFLFSPVELSYLLLEAYHDEFKLVPFAFYASILSDLFYYKLQFDLVGCDVATKLKASEVVTRQSKEVASIIQKHLEKDVVQSYEQRPLDTTENKPRRRAGRVKEESNDAD